jgi:hypothetical protein
MRRDDDGDAMGRLTGCSWDDGVGWLGGARVRGLPDDEPSSTVFIIAHELYWGSCVFCCVVTRLHATFKYGVFGAMYGYVGVSPVPTCGCLVPALWATLRNLLLSMYASS